MINYTKGEWKAWRFSKHHNWKVSMGDRNEFLDLGMDDESEANAQLIASAPDMYEALKHAEKTLRQNGIVPVLVIRALAKAEGE